MIRMKGKKGQTYASVLSSSSTLRAFQDLRLPIDPLSSCKILGMKSVIADFSGYYLYLCLTTTQIFIRPTCIYIKMLSGAPKIDHLVF